jgi:hypothetical protein
MSKGQGQFILVTLVGNINKIAVPVSRIFSVYQNDAATKTYIRYIGAKKPDEIVESITTVFNQQNVTLNNLNMILTTNVDTGRKVIYFTQHIKQMVEINTNDTKIMFDEAKYGNVIANESIGTIYAYQGSNKNLGMLLVTGKYDNIKRIFMTNKIKTIYPFPNDAGPVTGSILNYLADDRLIVNETPLQIYTLQPK